ncbi:DnaJ family domain-containing protein [Paenibacillus sp. SN-8-1]|uniref:DnaJ family domain-containing protein n=1 Tax=Paenibacillus sp. SN-8-1 TaxID=3435409 RepID=UPI003D9A8948
MFTWLAEQRITEAIDRGELEDLPGKGEPLQLEDLSHIPEDLRIAYKVMKNAGYVPEELTLRGECLQLEDLLQACGDPNEKQRLYKQLNEKTVKLRMMIAERRLAENTAFQQYEPVLSERFK